ncbi:MAG: hypothetical protein LBM93_15180 [Oscillospiraceae bacterium]|jgi:hypothetical protein|nr:hypothetical protein [Oscillospiraceae bacterium]
MKNRYTVVCINDYYAENGKLVTPGNLWAAYDTFENRLVGSYSDLKYRIENKVEEMNA